MTLKEVAEKYPTFTFDIIYDQWKCPGSTERKQVWIPDIPAKEMGEKYGNFILHNWYTESKNKADIWVIETEPEFCTRKENNIMIKLHARVTREIEVTEEQAERLLDALLGRVDDPELEDITEMFTEGIDSGNYENGYIPLEWAIEDLKGIASGSEYNLLKDGMPITGDIEL